jgi:peptidyl-prolyl cis-trans isomerase B (cyclophilin B)
MKSLFLILLTVLFSFTAFAKKQKEVLIKMETTKGTIILKLYNETPLHRDNFIKMVKSHSYDSLLFHRVINHFMIQGGDPNSKHAKPNEMLGNGEMPNVSRIPAEFKTDLYIHKKGVLAAARDNNPEKASSNCQFYIVQGRKYTQAEITMLSQRNGIKYTQAQIDAYINQGGTPHLDGGYTVYGEVVEGLDVLDKIEEVKTAPSDRPIEDVRIIKCSIYKIKKKFLFF